MTSKRIIYNKLVRDQIPEIIRASGGHCELEILSESAYRTALLEKLVEEAHEARSASLDDLSLELSDVLEVVDAIIEAFGLGRLTVLDLQQHRRAERGGLHGRIKLCWTE